MKTKLNANELLFAAKLKDIQTKVNKFVAKPDGLTKMTAARTCNDLKAYNPELKSGMYYSVFFLNYSRGELKNIYLTNYSCRDFRDIVIEKKKKPEEKSWIPVSLLIFDGFKTP